MIAKLKVIEDSRYPLFFVSLYLYYSLILYEDT